MDRSYADHLNGMDAGAQERLVREGFAAKVRRFGKRIPFVRDAAADDYRFSSLVRGIAKSIPFQMRRAQS